MFGSLKKGSFSAGAFALFCAVVLLSGCGQMLGSGSKNTRTSGGGLYGNGGSATGYGTQTGAGGSTTTRNPVGGTSGPNTGYDAALQECDRYRGAAFEIQNACGAFFQENWEELSSGCRAKFQDLYNNDCDGLKTRLQNVFNACGTDISQGMQYFPQNCQNVLHKYVR